MYGYILNMEMHPSEQKENIRPQEVVKNPRSIVLATATLYPNYWPEPDIQTRPETQDDLRGSLAIKTLSRAKELGFQIALVDGGSSQSFQRVLRDLDIDFRLSTPEGISSARRETLEMAGNLEGAKIICQTEPEKFFVVANIIPIAAGPILRNEADIVIPSRNLESFATYPSYQARSEQRSNKLYNQILRREGLLPNDSPDLDFWFGVRIFKNNPQVVDLFTKEYGFKKSGTKLHQKVNPEMYSNALFFPVVAALARGLRVKPVEVFYRQTP